MNAFKLSNISDNIYYDVKNIQIKFNNGETIFIAIDHINDFDLSFTRRMCDIFHDPVFKKAFMFYEGFISIDLPYIKQVLWDNIMDHLLYRNGINSLTIEYNDDFKIKSDSQMLLCIFDEHYGLNMYSKLSYEETGDSFVVRWSPVDLTK